MDRTEQIARLLDEISEIETKIKTKTEQIARLEAKCSELENDLTDLTDLTHDNLE